MKPLSLESINATSFYNVELSEREGFYQFFTDYGVHYAIGFVKSDLLSNDEVYELMIANLNNQSSKRDSHVREAIIAIIDDFLSRTTIHCYIYVKQEITNRLDEADCLSIGFLCTAKKHYLQCFQQPLLTLMAFQILRLSLPVMITRITLILFLSLQKQYNY